MALAGGMVSPAGTECRPQVISLSALSRRIFSGAAGRTGVPSVHGEEWLWVRTPPRSRERGRRLRRGSVLRLASIWPQRLGKRPGAAENDVILDSFT